MTVVVLNAATLNGATALGVDDRLGSVEVGKIGPEGPGDHASWELKIKPLRLN